MPKRLKKTIHKNPYFPDLIFFFSDVFKAGSHHQKAPVNTSRPIPIYSIDLIVKMNRNAVILVLKKSI